MNVIYKILKGRRKKVINSECERPEDNTDEI